MEKIHFNIAIKAPREKVWDVLWNEDTYKVWASAFSEDSGVRTDNWKKGSKVLFVDNSNSGMVSLIEEKIPNEFMSFKHLGEINNGVEDTTSERAQTWAGAHENYTLKESNGGTELEVNMDITGEFKEMFSAMWPKALQKVKELSES
ncbi:MAG TPA: SRPBCC domain-containing protein [Chitinophaga sp.]|uniref:SRPBCC domain-containing protein n=1 Tax=Chitinophaga sp. TaxID=1869181 RepID=UPI002C58F7AE|nr:SRPBCC domain-containing protein [Chitinophaga sp.]HVI46396.1 SRPBCC domain-containing protein [Chitinophaga sp.]